MMQAMWNRIDRDVYELPTFLSGRLRLSRGRAADYAALARFHYRDRRPATWAQVWTIRHLTGRQAEPHIRHSIVAVAVLSYPTLACHARDRALGLACLPPAEKRDFVNAHLRTISRVIVHPTFRSLGLAVALVRCILHHAPTRYTEALASMSRAHCLFDAAGMERFEAGEGHGPVYHLYDALTVGVDWD